ncbi:hypothetical protein Mp_3g24970 [Marchantia polymorpha subsp. ruderalis]|uniref:Uncharacterized protein n=2 Tax=Marchantia polymorpha TaxID=3197 RepID=A0AAF6B4I4_MARPO|nr:hypothetical protein MARPO_0100s0010 [Marchantia polymorpha]BBN06918.1 hypothetical protein Mp_3g24970 [Marchantia polymorpha subsp. ruderalis]|eukprot:PTQ32295.1 hypothetical protein MARPO_0100s0010 [Marchantia polymorpha]
MTWRRVLATLQCERSSRFRLSNQRPRATAHVIDLLLQDDHTLHESASREVPHSQQQQQQMYSARFRGWRSENRSHSSGGRFGVTDLTRSL